MDLQPSASLTQPVLSPVLHRFAFILGNEMFIQTQPDAAVLTDTSIASQSPGNPGPDQRCRLGTGGRSHLRPAT
jgi:hypothetical protein